MAVSKQPFSSLALGFAPPQSRCYRECLCPPGLEHLREVDQLLVKQQVELTEILIQYETCNTYQVVNSMDQKVYYAAEDSSCLARIVCGPLRSFNMTVLDKTGQQVMNFERPLRCRKCWFFCCLQEMNVYAPPGKPIGKVRQLWHPLKQKFVIMDCKDNKMLLVEGPCFTCESCGEIKFSVLAMDGVTEVGRVSKQWAGCWKETFTDADHFDISFPLDLDVRIKATLLALAFMIDFVYYESATKCSLFSYCNCLGFS